MHLLEVGLVLEGLAPGAVSAAAAAGGRLLLGAAFVGPGAAFRGSLHPRHLLEVVRLERTRHFVAAARRGAV